MSTIWVEIDVSKERLDVAVRPPGEVLTIHNDEAGIKKLMKVAAPENVDDLCYGLHVFPSFQWRA